MGGDLVLKMEAACMGLVALQMSPQRVPLSLPPCEETAKNHPSTDHEAGSLQTESAGASLRLDPSLQNCDKSVHVVYAQGTFPDSIPAALQAPHL